MNKDFLKMFNSLAQNKVIILLLWDEVQNLSKHLYSKSNYWDILSLMLNNMLKYKNKSIFCDRMLQFWDIQLVFLRY